jgi:hypothetical protein
MRKNASIIDELRAARDAGVIDARTLDSLSEFLTARAQPEPDRPRFNGVNVLWYLGALIVLGSMGLFSTTAFGLWGLRSLIATAVIYGAAFLAAGAFLWRRDLRTPGGLLIACAVGMAPLFIFAVQALADATPGDVVDGYHGFYVWVKSSFLPMETGTIVAALLALAFFPFPFLTMIVAFALWFMSMDLTPWLLQADYFSYDQRASVSMAFGAVTLAVAWLVDLKKWRNGDFAFWLHLFGLMAFWGGLTEHHSGSEFSKALYCGVNLGLVALSIFLMRRAYAVFGGIGVTLYLGYLANDVFKDSILFPFALSAMGLGVIGVGLFFHYYGAKIGAALGELLPDHVKGLRPAHAREG